ncbi:MAG: ROK family protein [Methanobacteriota archaeon]
MLIAGAVDIGGTNTRVALIREDGFIMAIERFKTPRGLDPVAVPIAAGDALLRLAALHPGTALCGIGVSAAGPVDLNAGSIRHPPNMPFDEVSIVRPLRNLCNCPVTLMNDCRAAVLGEVFTGAGMGFHHVVYITFSTGIGGGVYTDGRVLLGRGGNAGEIGHFIVDTTYMQSCSCGLSGHWEGYASGKGITRFFQTWCRVHEMDPGSPLATANDILNAATRGEPVAKLFIGTLARINACGLSIIIVAYDPEIIILDGPVVVNHPDIILTSAIEHIDRYLDLPKIVISPLGGNAPLLGAAAAMFRLSERPILL